MSVRLTNILTGLLVIIIILALDQATKHLMLDLLFDQRVHFEALRTYKIVELTSYLNLVPVWNKGISFGLLATSTPEAIYGFAGIALLIVFILTYLMIKTNDWFFSIGVGFVIGGAIGNVIDRIRFGAVVDFLDFHLYDFHWPAFNIADSAITLGVLLILWHQILEPTAESQKKEKKTPVSKSDSKKETKTVTRKTAKTKNAKKK